MKGTLTRGAGGPGSGKERAQVRTRSGMLDGKAEVVRQRGGGRKRWVVREEVGGGVAGYMGPCRQL